MGDYEFRCEGAILSAFSIFSNKAELMKNVLLSGSSIDEDNTT